jgi:glycosyltransferase involved in cell wall biosynthesis
MNNQNNCSSSLLTDNNSDRPYEYSLKSANSLFKLGQYLEAKCLYLKFQQLNPSIAAIADINVRLCEKRLSQSRGQIASQSSTPLVSVIIPCHNVEHYLDKCLESVVLQSLRNIEIIVIDDGSTDGTFEIIKKYSNQDDRIVCIRNMKASGSSGTPRNQAIMGAKGEYLAFVDSDDWIDPEMLFDLYHEAKSQDADISSCSGFFRELSNGTTEKVETKYNAFDGAYDRERLFLSPHFPIVWFRIYRKSFVLNGNILFANTKTSSDLPFAFQALFLANKVSEIGCAYYHYRFDRPGSTIDRRRGSGAFELFESYKQIIRFLIKHNAVEKCLQYVLIKALGDFDYNNRFLAKEYRAEFRLRMGEFSGYVAQYLKNRELLSVYQEKLYREIIKESEFNDSIDWASYIDSRPSGSIKVPHVSVIIPAHNVEGYIADCLASVVNQSIGNLEVVIINDGSTDQTTEIINDYSRRYSQIRVVHCMRANGNPGTPRNIGLMLATGKYIGFVDSDDWVESDMYERLYKSASESMADIVSASKFIRHIEDESTSININYKTKDSGGELQSSPFLSGYFSNIWNRIYSKCMIDRHGLQFPDIYITEDLCFSVTTHYYAKRTEVVDGAFYHYRYSRPNSTTDLRQSTKGFEIINNFDSMFEYLKSHISDNGILADALTLKCGSLLYTYDRMHDPVMKKNFYESARVMLRKYQQLIKISSLNSPNRKRIFDLIS